MIIMRGKNGEWITVGKTNEVKKRILDLIMDKKEISLSEIHKKIKDTSGKTYNYRTIWQHIQNLHKEGVIDMEKREHEAGKPVIIKFPPKEFQGDKVPKLMK